MMYRKTFAEINLNHLKHNIDFLMNNFSDRFICPMVKANAYGHGDVVIAQHLESWGIKQVGVCLIEEGLLLRNNQVHLDILVFRGFDKAGAKEIVAHNMIPVVSSWDQIDYLEEVATKPIRIHVKFDTGMNRLGFQPQEKFKVFEKLNGNPKFKVEGLLTHLFHGEDADLNDGDSFHQLNLLLKVFDVFKPLNPIVHSLNTSGIIHSYFKTKNSEVHHTLLSHKWGLRPGLLIYGYNPLNDKDQQLLKPVMNLKSHVGNLRHLKKGESVSYNATWKAQRDSLIAVVPIGYADGFHRRLSNKASALIHGHRVPIVGSICMDYLMLDVTELQNLTLNLKDIDVTLFGYDHSGEFISANELARYSNTISWEILSNVGERVPRVYSNSFLGV